jgi:hypothetical protein
MELLPVPLKYILYEYDQPAVALARRASFTRQVSMMQTIANEKAPAYAMREAFINAPI